MASLGEATGKVASALPRSITGADAFRGVYMLGLAAAIGLVSGISVPAVGDLVRQAHILFFQLYPDALLSAQYVLKSPNLALLPALGGVLMGLSILLARRFSSRPPIDPIEANAVHGGRMSMRESLLVTAQTIISSAFGASVGLEAGYTQLNAGIASQIATRLRLRRNEVRTLVGCGAASAIAAAFNAPLTGAFYGFEIIIGVYSPSLLAPVIVSSLAASLTASYLGTPEAPVDFSHLQAARLVDVLPFVALGVIGGGVAIGIMRLVALLERALTRLKLPPFFRPMLGGFAVGALALVTPQVMSSGHGALALQLTNSAALGTIAMLFLLKTAASVISLGSGFRGGLFFASLYLGALMGKLFAAGVVAIGVAPDLAPTLGALVGMASLAVGIVGGPLTMTFLVLETTGNLQIAAAVLAAAVVASFLVRETFGYSFSTWRLHLRGETIRGAHDVGRLRALTVGPMMRVDVRTVQETMLVSAFCEKYPLGSTERVVALDGNGRYAGIIVVADAHFANTETASEQPKTLTGLLQCKDVMLLPSTNAQEAAQLFEKAGSEELAVVDNLDRRRVVGLLTEAYLLRRYAEELDKGWRDLTGESR
ncbi:MAG TPA: chloride channel protein [Devosia sp.]|nr:chloride channel protein [Devosia sp.]